MSGAERGLREGKPVNARDFKSAADSAAIADAADALARSAARSELAAAMRQAVARVCFYESAAEREQEREAAEAEALSGDCYPFIF